MNTFFLANTPLFHGIKEVEISEMLHCLNAREKKYKKDEIIFRAGTSGLGLAGISSAAASLSAAGAMAFIATGSSIGAAAHATSSTAPPA